jgi:hypothetical protein
MLAESEPKMLRAGEALPDLGSSRRLKSLLDPMLVRRGDILDLGCGDELPSSDGVDLVAFGRYMKGPAAIL